METNANKKSENKSPNKTMKKYLETLLDEKGIDRESFIEIDEADCFRLIPYQCIIEFICIQEIEVQNKIKKQLIKIDFINGDVKSYFNNIAEGIDFKHLNKTIETIISEEE